MKVELLHNTPLNIADIAISKCYGKKPYEDLDKQQGRINRVANVSKHASTIEHLSYNFDIDGISRACLQELARHRIASYTVKSSRYTLQELKDEDYFYLDDASVRRALNYVILTNNIEVNCSIIETLNSLRELIKKGVPNDIAKYCMPEAYKTSLVMTINARALQNFLSLRTDKHALLEIQNLARAMYEVIPEDHKFLFTEYVNIGE
jgi:thymidylate synthase (FAD)